MVQSGVNSVPSGMMVGRPGNQQQAPGQGSLGNPSSKQIHSNFINYNFNVYIYSINQYILCVCSGTNE